MEQRTQHAKAYDPKDVERRWYRRWEESGVFHEEPDPSRPPFVIAMPPPNITGRAHLGHGSTYTTMDVLTRFHRMLGDNAVWIPGLDHAAIATQAVLDRELAKEGKTRHDLGREKFLERARAWKEEYGGVIDQQFRLLGFGPDWARERYTMDPELSAAVIKVFVDLYREGLIYRGTRLINWCPTCASTLSDAEVEHEERDGHLWHIRYPFAEDAEPGSPASSRAGEESSSDDSASGGTSHQLGSPASSRAGVEVATTRPETMLGDTAIAVHPEDERYRGLVGKHVVLPLQNRRIPIIADAAVEREFGTGAVKVTPAHDPTDYEIGVRHSLPMPSVLGFDAKMTSEAGKAYEGLDRYEARKRVVAELEAQGFLVKTEPHHHSVATCSRCGTVIEPLLSLQWFVKMEPLAKPALEAYRDGRLRFVPERHGRTYAQWLENIRDWNISRQVWWGHRLPVWYTPNGDVIVAESEEEAQRIAGEQYHTTEITRDEDTLDTWFSSGLWPFSILGWPKRTKELETWYPTQVLVTAQEIIFLWVARMVMLGMHFVDRERPPFRDVLIAPLVFDQFGRKMSKSLGNSIDPLDLIEKYGADATRLGIIRQMHLESQELRFSESRCEEARNFNNKIWNAARYVLSLPDLAGLAKGGVELPPAGELTLADRWILARLRGTVETVTEAYRTYEFSTAADRLWRFFWNEYCDWYVEATKQPSKTRASVLSMVLDVALRLLHPIAPFITEEIWQMLPQRGTRSGESWTIVRARWPNAEELPLDEWAAGRFETLMEIIVALRRLKAEAELPASATPLAGVLDLTPGLNEEEKSLIARLARVQVLEGPQVTVSLRDLTARVGQGTVFVHLGEEAAAREIARLESEERRLMGEVERLEKKLSNASFALKAPPEIVQKEREKLAGYAEELRRTRQRLTELRAT